MLPALGTALPGMLLLPLLPRSAWPCFFQDLRFAQAKALAIALVAMQAQRAGARTVLDIFAGRAPHKPLMLFGYEGRTGTACIPLKENSEFNRESTYRHVTHLPNYARPRFIRIKSTTELTATFKYCKVQLMEEGFNPAVIKDCLYFLDDEENVYVRITQDIYNSVKNHDFKLSM